MRAYRPCAGTWRIRTWARSRLAQPDKGVKYSLAAAIAETVEDSPAEIRATFRDVNPQGKFRR